MPGDGTYTNNAGWRLTTHQYLLTLIMMVATAYRFCDVDTFNLWGTELTHALAVTHIGYWDLVRNMIYGDVNPPGYRTVLYLFTQWFGVSDFVLRAPSLLAGIATVYMIFVLGRRCISATAGLLAAALLAGSSAAVFASQEVNFSGVFTLYALASFYCFVEMFFLKPTGNFEAASPQTTLLNLQMGNFSFEWKAAIAIRPALLAWFWFINISLVYLHYTGWLVLASELVVLVVWCRTGRSHCTPTMMQWAFIPIILASLAWLPACYIHLQKTWPQFVFNAPNIDSIKQLTVYLLGIDPLMRALIAIGLLLTVTLPISTRLINMNVNTAHSSDIGGLALFVLLLLTMLLLSACTASLMSAPAEFMTLLPFIILFSSVGTAGLIDALVLPRWRPALLALLVPLLMIVQLHGQMKFFVFNDHRKADITSPLKLIMQDSVFMAGNRKIFMSHEGLEYYLDTLNIRRQGRFQLNPRDPADSNKVAKVIDDNIFYYVDIIFDASVKYSSPMLDALSQKYGQLCLTRFPSARLVKFSAALPPSGTFSNDECPDNTTDLNKPLGAIK